MDKRAAKALEGSIYHWEENVAAVNAVDAFTNAEHCALCAKFQDWNLDCKGCPVSTMTRNGMCIGTPYVDADAALKRWLRNPNDESCKAAWRVAAQAELDFLISLREA